MGETLKNNIMINLKKLISRRKKKMLRGFPCYTLSAGEAKQKTLAVRATQGEEFREIISNINKDIQSKIDEGLCEVNYDPDSIPDTVRAYYKNFGYHVEDDADLNSLSIYWGPDVVIS
jgi:hypothetical protein